MADPASESRFGFVAVLGAPNVGKSTLINRMVGAKVTIVSPKVQTTRIRVLGIVVRDGSQIVFVDTPGIFTPRRRLDRAMVAAAWKGAGDADLICVLVDAARGIDANTGRILDGLRESGRKAVLVLNKIDTIKREKLLGLSAELNATGLFSDTFMVSALKGDGVDDLFEYLAGQVPEGTWHFPEDQLSDLPQRLLAAEITREKLFLLTHEEVPYSVAVETELWEETRDGGVRVEQSIYVQRDSQRPIILGKGGRLIKRIGSEARRELADMLDRQVHLFLHVKVREKWADERDHYRVWGLDYNA